MNMAEEGSSDLAFREPSSGGIDLNVNITQQSRDYSEHFRMYKFWYTMRIAFSRDADMTIFVSDLLNVHSDALERIFSIVFQTMVESVQLQHFNRNNIIDTDYLQFTLEHSDFVNYVFSSRSVAHEHFNYERIIGGVMNWLNNLSQSNQMIDISRDWMICLMVSRLEEVPRGMGGKRKHDDGKEVECQFPVHVMVNDNNDDDDDVMMFPNSMPFGTSPEFNPSSIINVQNEEFKDNEEYRLFGTPSSTHSDDDNDGPIEEDDNHQRGDGESNTAIESDDNDDDDDDEMDDDTGTSFTPLFNNDALNFFMNSEVSTVNSTFMVDYFNDECFGNDSELHGECVLIAMYVYYFHLTQHKNFNRTMKNKLWLRKSVKKKLIKIK